MINSNVDYKPRLIDEKVEKYLGIFGAISIEGPKWCGKTRTAERHANSAVYLDDSTENFDARNKAMMDVSLILNEEAPELIDEWGEVPEIWDAVRHMCDKNSARGKYILTESTTLRKKEDEDKIHHSGAGRIDKMKMYSMSLYESGESSGKASITDMFNGTQKNCNDKKYSYEDIARLIVRGGWPGNLEIPDKSEHILPRSYLKALLDNDINKDGVERDRAKMEMLLKSLARNESTICTNKKIISDMMYDSNDYIKTNATISDYLNVLNKLNILANDPAYSPNIRSSVSIGKNPKRHFTDPSLACAALGITKEKLMDDTLTYGFMFESLVERDLRIYMDYLDGKLYHYRDNKTGHEVDAIVELPDGEYGIIEIKLSSNGVEDAKESLLKFENSVVKKPKFKCIIVGLWDAVVKDPVTNTYIVPLTSLRP